MFDWTQYTGNLEWLPKRTIFLTRHRSAPWKAGAK